MLELRMLAGNVIELVTVDAHPIDVSFTIKNWIARIIEKVSPDIYVFFAGRGLAADDG